jgi:DNA modification methylase
MPPNRTSRSARAPRSGAAARRSRSDADPTRRRTARTDADPAQPRRPARGRNTRADAEPARRRGPARGRSERSDAEHPRRRGPERGRGGPPARSAPEPRSSLTQRGGKITSEGDPELCAALAASLAAADSDETNDLTHGFHTYPARMHPRLARELIARFSQPGAVVLDPFCGSGTLLVEAMVAGCKPQGVDLNPLALRITEAHCALRSPAERRRFQEHLHRTAQASEERVRTRARAHIEIDRATQQFYQSHVLFELCGLREEIEAVPDEADKRALLIVFSSLLIKFSRKRADTSNDADVVDKRIRKGLVTEFFARKGHELSLRWEALYDAAPEDAFEARLMCGDARELKRLLGAGFRADLIATSPPYGGTYDYARHHTLRNAWFGFDTERLQDREIGARRRLSRGHDGVERWDEELLAALRAMREVCAEGARVILWSGDAEVSGVRVPVDQQVAALAADAALTLRASAAQPRQDPRGGPDRMERLLLLETVPRNTR